MSTTFLDPKVVQLLGVFSVTAVACAVAWSLCRGQAPKVIVAPVEEEEASNPKTPHRKFCWDTDRTKEHVPCWDPATMDYLGEAPAMTPEQVIEKIQLARDAQKCWAKSTFVQRRYLLRIILRFIVENMETIAKVTPWTHWMALRNLCDICVHRVMVACRVPIHNFVRHKEFTCTGIC